MNDFDANLIREFRSRPAFYDRNNPKFKDKVFTAREWQEISNKLGYDVSLLKDRMLQLRNRYNLEKRRIEQLREENPGAAVESPWPLFDHLHFLAEHIRARRSYKRMLNSAPQHSTRLDLPSGGSNTSSGGVGNDDDADENSITQLNMHTAAAFPNGFLPVRVKMEHDDDAEINNSNSSDVTASAAMNGNIPTLHMQAYQQHHHQQQQQQQHHHQQSNHHQAHLENIQQNDTDADESECQSVTDTNAFLAPQTSALLSNKQYAFAAKQQQQQQQQYHQHQQQLHHQQQQQQLQQHRLNPAAPPPLKIRRIDSMRVGGKTNTWIPVPQTSSHKRHHNNSSSSSHSNNLNCSYNNLQHTSKIKPPILLPPTYVKAREQKYAAFGEFVASSLLDLPSVTAMHLIEKFTTEVVKVLIENDGAMEREQIPKGAGSNCNGIASGAGN